MSEVNHNSKLIIGITGVKHSGKNTVANYLVKKYGFIKRNLSEPLKTVCRSLFNFSNEQVDGEEKDIPDIDWFGLTPRETMQFMTTDLRKHMKKLKPEFGENIFIRNFDQWYKIQTNNYVVIPDVTFQNEVDYIRSKNGIILKILYHSTPNEVSLMDKIFSFFGINTESEPSIGYDISINNEHEHNITDLYAQIEKIMLDKFDLHRKVSMLENKNYEFFGN